MTICVLSDVHGNHLALEACLACAQERGAQAYIFLGDYISDGAYPQKTLEALYACAARYDCRFIRGNREEYMLERRAGGQTHWRDGSATGSLLYTYENLTEKDLDWFAGLDNQGRAEFPGYPPLLYCHGSPWSTRGVLPQGDPEVQEKLLQLPERWVLHGHIHRFRLYTIGPNQLLPRWVICAGSVGLPLSTPGRSQMLLLHSVEGAISRWREEFVLVPYDAEGAAEELASSGLMERGRIWTAIIRHALLTGENLCTRLPSYAQSLYKEDTGIEATWTEVPESYWQRAAGALL